MMTTGKDCVEEGRCEEFIMRAFPKKLQASSFRIGVMQSMDGDAVHRCQLH
jgi:hypothetical protein